MIMDAVHPGNLLAMAMFALVTSITPGPVNIILAISGARHGVRKAKPYILGATLGFTSLLIGIGLGLGVVIKTFPFFSTSIKAVGIVYMLYLAYRIVAGGVATFSDQDGVNSAPSMVDGVLTQLLNPKAWTVSLSANALYVAGNDSPVQALLVFSIVFSVVCYFSLWLWAKFGSEFIRASPKYAALFHWILGLGLVLSIFVIFLW